MPTFYDAFLERAERWPQNVALEIQRRDHTESYTYAQTRQMAESVGRWISESGLEAGARLAILADNHPRWVAAYLGMIAAGCTAVPLDTAFHADQVAKLLKDSGSVILFTDAKHRAVAETAVAGLDVSIVLTDAGGAGTQAGSARLAGNLDSIFGAGPGAFRPKDSPPDAIAALLYTSGTTADPKGVMLTHANLMGEAAAVFGRLRLTPDDAILGILPLFHSLAQMANLMLPLVAGTRVVYLETLNTTELLRALKERNITVFCVVPQFFYLIHERILKEVKQRGKMAERGLRLLMGVNRELRKIGINAGRLFFGPIHQTFGPNMRYLVTGGSRFDPQIGRDFHALGIDVMQAYGLTETCGGAFVNPPDDIVIGSVGKPLPSVEGKILDPQPDEDGGRATGEVAIRGPIVMKGYWNRPDATAAVMKDDWLLTGDLGYFDDDGNLFLTGRKKELIVLANGKNIYPEEIEAYYLKSAFIKEICVMALEGTPGDASSEHLHGVIVPNFELFKERKIANMKDVIRYEVEGVSTNLPTTKRIGSFEIWQEDLPRTTTRKLKRFQIERRVRADGARGEAGEDPTSRKARDVGHPTAEEQAWLERPEVQKALGVILERARNTPECVLPGDNLELDLGLDSMQRVELLTTLEEQLGGDVQESQLAEIYTVRELVDAVLTSAASGEGGPGTRPQFAGWKAILAEEPTERDVLDLARNHPYHDAFLFLMFRLMQVIAADRGSLKVSGVEKLPHQGPYIISSNHQSYVDPFILAGALPHRIFANLFAVGTSDIFTPGIMAKLANFVRTIVVDADANLVPAMRAGAYGLRHGRILVLYPEGERSINGEPIVFKKGAAILSIHMQAPIVPVAIEGFYDMWPRGKKFQGFFPLKVQFGEPIYPLPESEASEAAYEKLTAELKGRVVEMRNAVGGR